MKGIIKKRAFWRAWLPWSFIVHRLGTCTAHSPGQVGSVKVISSIAGEVLANPFQEFCASLDHRQRPLDQWAMSVSITKPGWPPRQVQPVAVCTEQTRCRLSSLQTSETSRYRGIATSSVGRPVCPPRAALWNDCLLAVWAPAAQVNQFSVTLILLGRRRPQTLTSEPSSDPWARWLRFPPDSHVWCCWTHTVMLLLCMCTKTQVCSLRMRTDRGHSNHFQQVQHPGEVGGGTQNSLLIGEDG